MGAFSCGIFLSNSLERKKFVMKKIVEMVFENNFTTRRVVKGIFIAVASLVVVVAMLCASTKAAEVKAKTEAPPPKVKAIVICCSDPRLDMIDLIRERYGFGKGECFPIVVPGGPDPLANPTVMECKCQAEKEYMDIILDPKHHFPFLEKIVVAEHEDCACIKHYGFTDPHQGKKDFPAIKEFFDKRTPGLELVMLYYSFTNREKGIVNPDPEVIKLD